MSATQLKNVTWEVAELPQGVRTIAPVTITVSGATPQGARTLSITKPSGTAVVFRKGQSFTVLNSSINRRVQILVREETSLASNETTGEIPISDLLDPIPDAVTFEYRNLYPVLGVQTFDYQTAPQTVDSTDTLSGIGMESEQVRADKTQSLSIIVRPANRGYWDVIVPVADSSIAKFGRELFSRMVYPNGMVREGVVKITQFSEPGNQNEIFKSTVGIQYQGETYVRNAPYTFAA